MISFLQVCEEFRNRLDRQLKDEELNFLRWLYARYLDEHNESYEWTKS
ncbi:MAG TPA: hypothetical protein VK057_01200 [Bacillota bacterium]|nr:hypothetical protein [Bacillota bacterium]